MSGILIVDDDKETLQAIRSILDNSPFSEIPAWRAESAAEALEQLKEQQPDYVLTELSLPDMDGIEFGKKVLKLHPDLNILIVSHLQMFKMAQASINAGFSAYLLKPVASGELLEVLNRLHGARLLHETTPYLEEKGDGVKEIDTDLGKPIQTAVNYIRMNYNKPVHLKEAADLVYLSPSHFSRLFKEETGTTFVEYLTDHRLERSKHLLKYTTMPIETVASLTGFASAAYFSTSFKRKEGMTPSEYRHMCTFSSASPH